MKRVEYVQPLGYFQLLPFDKQENYERNRTRWSGEWPQEAGLRRHSRLWTS